MIKNGLFLCSIGLIVFVYSANMNTGKYDFLSMATAIFLMAVGGYFFFKGRKKDQLEKKQKNGEVKK